LAEHITCIKNYCVSIKEGSIFIADNAITPAGMRKLFISEICRSDALAFFAAPLTFIAIAHVLMVGRGGLRTTQFQTATRP
jgi:hypothetical protein